MWVCFQNWQCCFFLWGFLFVCFESSVKKIVSEKTIYMWIRHKTSKLMCNKLISEYGTKTGSIPGRPMLLNPDPVWVWVVFTPFWSCSWNPLSLALLLFFISYKTAFTPFKSDTGLYHIAPQWLSWNAIFNSISCNLFGKYYQRMMVKLHHIKSPVGK